MATLTWINTAGGSWNTAANWSGGTVPGSGDEAVIAGTGTFEVSISAVGTNAATTVQSVLLDDPNATLVISGTLQPAGVVSLQAGTLDVDGTIAGGTMAVTGGVLGSYLGTLNGVTLAGSESVGLAFSSLGIVNGLTLVGANGSGPGTLTLDSGTLNFEGTQTVSGGAIILAGTSYPSELENYSGTLTIAAGTTILADGTQDLLSDSGASLSTLQNNGTILVPPGGSLTLEEPIVGSGAIEAAGGTIVVNTEITTAELAGLGAGVTIVLSNTGTLDNQGQILTLGSTGVSDLEFQGGTVIGGTLSFQPGGTVSDNYYAAGNALVGVTLQGSESLQIPSNESLNIYNGLSLQGSGGTGPGTLTLTSGQLTFDGGGTISGGTIALGDFPFGSDFPPIEISSNSGTLTIAPNVVLTATGFSNVLAGSVVNDGLITIGAGGEITLGAQGGVINAGTIEAAPGAVLALAGSFANSGTIIDAGATVMVSNSTVSLATLTPLLNPGVTLELGTGGVLQNTGTLTIGSGAVGGLVMDGGTIAGGAIQMLQGGSLRSEGGTLSGVTLDGSETAAGFELGVANGLTLSGGNGTGSGTLDLSGSLTFLGNEVLSGGTVLLGSAVPFAYDPGDLTAYPGTLTLAPSVSVIALNPGDGLNGDILNDGAVSIAAGGQLTIGSGGTFDNAGGIAVAAGGILIIAGSIVNTGSISIAGTAELAGSVTLAQFLSDEAVVGASLGLAGALDNTGHTLSVGPGSFVGTLVVDAGGMIENGVVSDTGDSFILAGGTLSNVDYIGTLDVTDPFYGFGGAAILNGITFSGFGGGRGSVIVAAGSALNVESGETIDNVNVSLSGELLSYAYSSNGFPTGPGTLTLGGQASITQAGTVASMNGGFLASAGTITLAQAGSNLMIGGLSNSGSLLVSDGEVVSVIGLQNSGLVSVSDGGVLNLGGLGSTLVNTGQITETNATLNLDGSLSLGFLNSITRAGGIVSIGNTLALGGGTLSVGTDTALGQLRDNGVISGGTIHDAGGGLVYIANSGGGTLSADTYEGTVNLVPENSTLTVTGGLRVTGANGTGAGIINLLGNASTLNFLGSQTLSNVTINVGDGFDATNLAVLDPTGAGAVLTLGAGAAVTQWGARAEISIGRGYGDSLVNDGVIGAVATNGAMLIQGGTFTNNGKVMVASGETLSLQADSLSNLAGGTLAGGNWQVNANSTLNLGYDNPITTLDATLYLGGPGAQVEYSSSATDQQVTLSQSLQSVGAGGGLYLAGGASFAVGSAFNDHGNIVLAGGTFAAQPLTVFQGANVYGAGTVVANDIYDSGVVMAQNGLLVLDAPLLAGSPVGAAWINVGATLDASSAVAVPVRFVGSTGELQLAQASALGGTISGFTGSDLIDLQNVGATGLGLSYASSGAGSGVLTVSTNGTTDAALHFAGNYVTANFTAFSDGHGGTLIKDPPVPVTPATLNLGGMTFAAGGQTNGAEATDVATPTVLTAADIANTPTPAAGGGAVSMGGTMAATPGVGLAMGDTSQNTMLTAAHFAS